MLCQASPTVNWRLRKQRPGNLGYSSEFRDARPKIKVGILTVQFLPTLAPLLPVFCGGRAVRDTYLTATREGQQHRQWLR